MCYLRRELAGELFRSSIDPSRLTAPVEMKPFRNGVCVGTRVLIRPDPVHRPLNVGS